MSDKKTPSAQQRLKAAFRIKKLATGDNDRPADLKKLPNAFQLFIQACKMPIRHWEIFGGILGIYAVLSLLLIGGLSQSGDLQLAKEGLNEAFTGQFGGLITGLALFGELVADGAGSAASGVASAYQTMLLVVISLALIWALRQVYAAHPIRIRDAFYNGMHPLVQFVFVTLIIGLQTVPALVGGFMFAALVGGGILQNGIEIVIVAVVLFALLAWSVYMLSSSLFAVYIVTLPDMTPMQALRSAKEMVRFRRGAVLRKLLFLPVVIVLAAVVIMVPVSLLLTPVAPLVFFALTIIAVLAVHSYMYAVYRELIA